MMIFTLVREHDDVVVSGTDGAGMWHDELVGTVGVVSRDRGAIKVWPGDSNAGDGSGKLWFEWVNVRRLMVLPEQP